MVASASATLIGGSFAFIALSLATAVGLYICLRTKKFTKDEVCSEHSRCRRRSSWPSSSMLASLFVVYDALCLLLDCCCCWRRDITSSSPCLPRGARGQFAVARRAGAVSRAGAHSLCISVSARAAPCVVPSHTLGRARARASPCVVIAHALGRARARRRFARAFLWGPV